MEEDTWSFGLSTSLRTYKSALQSQSGFCEDFEEIEEEEEDDDLQIEYPCPFCADDFDLVELCCHIDEEHPEGKFGVCPICATRVDMNMVGHISTQHGNILKGQHTLKLLKGESLSLYSSLKKELEDAQFRSFLAGSSSPLFSPSKIEPDPLLSFIYNAPRTDRYETVEPNSSAGIRVEDKKNSDEELLDKDRKAGPLSEKDELKKRSRREFVEGLLLSTIFEEGGGL